jgi:cytoskeletal protein CcmA (bactofilin family)
VSRRLLFVASLLALAALSAPVAASGASAGNDGDDPVVVISGNVTVERGETVEGVFIASGDARIAGRVDGDVVVFNGDVLLSGTVDGDLFTATGKARLLPSAEVTGDLSYSDEHPQIAFEARVRGDIDKQGWQPDVGGAIALIGGFLVWLAISLSMFLLGGLLLLVAPRAADSLYERSRERLGPTIAIGLAILIVLPIAGVIAAVTVLGIPLALLLFLALLPLGAVAYVAAAWALGRRILAPPRHRLLAFAVGLAILRAAALVPILGLFVGLAALVAGLGLLGAAIGAARDPERPEPARSPGI